MFIKLLCNSLCLRKKSFHIKGRFYSCCSGAPPSRPLLTSCKDHPILVPSSPLQPQLHDEAAVASPVPGAGDRGSWGHPS